MPPPRVHPSRVRRCEARLVTLRHPAHRNPPLAHRNLRRAHRNLRRARRNLPRVRAFPLHARVGLGSRHRRAEHAHPSAEPPAPQSMWTSRSQFRRPSPRLRVHRSVAPSRLSMSRSSPARRRCPPPARLQRAKRPRFRSLVRRRLRPRARSVLRPLPLRLRRFLWHRRRCRRRPCVRRTFPRRRRSLPQLRSRLPPQARVLPRPLLRFGLRLPLL